MEHIIGAGAKPAAGNSAAAGDLIRDVTIETFAAEVLDASAEVPVIVDFWAPWCGPCRQLTPVLEKAVREAKGAVRLAKINIDDNPEIAREMRVQSVPTVYAFKNGQPVDGFMGAQPESQVKAFIKRLAGAPGAQGPSQADQIVEAATAAMQSGDIARAAQAFASVVQAEPGHPGALAGLARCYIKAGEVKRAEQTLGLVPPEHESDERVASVRAELKLASQSAGVGDLSRLVARLEGDPDDHQSRYDLALALFGKGERKAAVDHLIEILRRDRAWNEEAARKQLLTFFEAMGPADPAAAQGRRKLSALLFS